MDTKVPKVENAKIVQRRIRAGCSNPRCFRSTTTMIKVGNSWLVDPSREEERVLETKMTIGTTEEHVCAMQKAKGSLSQGRAPGCHRHSL